MSFRHPNQQTPSATQLLYRHHADEGGNDVEGESGTCCFCGHDGPGVSVDDAINHDYFSDYNLMTADTGHVCAACAYCMGQRGLKQGHWVASADTYESVSTGDLPEIFQQVRADGFDTPLALHVSENPIRSEHAYLWTPVVHSTDPLVVTYGKQTVSVDWREFDTLLAAVEELRWHGFRGDDIRSGEPRVRDLESIGTDRYGELDHVIEPHRGTPFLEVVWTLSRSKDDQDEPPASAST